MGDGRPIMDLIATHAAKARAWTPVSELRAQDQSCSPNLPMNQRMPTSRLGGSNLDVSRVGLGLMSLSGLYGESSDDNGVAVIHHALDRGIDFFDSADMYGWGHNETLLGRALRESSATRREAPVIATKFGQVKLESGGNGVDGRPEYGWRQLFWTPAKIIVADHEYVQAACEASLRRLGLETIDLYYVHRIDPKVPIEDTVGAMARLIEQGKVRSIGLCEANPATIRRAHKVHPLAALQTEYSLLYREESGGDPEDNPGARHRIRCLCAARTQPAHRRGRRWRRGRERPAEGPSAFPRREIRAQPRHGDIHRGDGQAKTMHAGAAGTCLAACTRGRH